MGTGLIHSDTESDSDHVLSNYVNPDKNMNSDSVLYGFFLNLQQRHCFYQVQLPGLFTVITVGCVYHQAGYSRGFGQACPNGGSQLELQNFQRTS